MGKDTVIDWVGLPVGTPLRSRDGARRAVFLDYDQGWALIHLRGSPHNRVMQGGDLDAWIVDEAEFYGQAYRAVAQHDRGQE